MLPEPLTKITRRDVTSHGSGPSDPSLTDMRRSHFGIPAALASLMLLAGCSAGTAGDDATDEAILGGVETVAPGFDDPAEDQDDSAVSLTAQSVIDAIMSAGAYSCAAASDSVRECTPDDPASGALRVESSAGGVDITGEAPIDGGTVGALAELIGVEAEELYTADGGLEWSGS